MSNFWAIHHPWSPKSSHEMLAKSAGRQHFVKGQPPRCFGAENSKVLLFGAESRVAGEDSRCPRYGGAEFSVSDQKKGCNIHIYRVCMIN